MLSLGYHVHFSDVDVVYIRPVRPSFQALLHVSVARGREAPDCCRGPGARGEGKSATAARACAHVQAYGPDIAMMRDGGA